ncbi:alkane 1-monooxygenase [Fulvivirga sedimenti]|uniref:Alkane 1-monooxygenase n=1 Tax=Fulvivirga sedimenti TaxID=2879465 RepID=A0A9X1HR51_9BACT|nr:alkane 1-monooxygenase [Fulvivirga sedimenti]MCA6075237.1 alkane 1-monooxygenase [Fulvivirga sedimenti]MCA6076414.1 alkane 1-monooxygenase [Fulvivirga sedimenti]MCA6077542.1 alkane 1-monooxygenase [Fulvivirga sedimenti]
MAFIIPASVIVGYYLAGWWNMLSLALVFLIIPFLDYMIGTSDYNIPKDRISIISEQFFYRFVTYLWTYFQLLFLAWAFYVVTFGHLSSVQEWIGFTLGTGLVTGGIGITVAHELGHKKSALERLYSKILLLTVCYMHFYIEHNKGHHVTVATPEDPATSRKNESFYAFWFRSVFHGYAHAWKIENNRLRRKGVSALSIHNEMIWFSILPLIFIAVVTGIFSIWANHFVWQLPVFFFVQSFIAFTLLEQVNYIEHYGIERKEIAPGKYERVTPIHSWNASHVISNFFLFQLQRHSDHHANAIKRYQVLYHYDESPQLPAGYSTMIILALVPGLWFHLMNPRLESWQLKSERVQQ